ncbi:protachykinin-like [Narcine bancroftii]|uniref:protachykinin-like n=1 Tax=Narcine bancroftii TaxID=1343680 RepID=UPI003831D52A
MRSRRLLGLTAVLILIEVFCEEISPSEGTSLWVVNNLSQEKRLKETSTQELFRRMIRKPQLEQFFGLMGRRSLGNKPLTRKRHKLEKFVGLMGKRSSVSGSSSEWKGASHLVQRH